MANLYYTFPTMEHQYAPLFRPSANYYKGSVVRVPIGTDDYLYTYKVYKFLKDAPADTISSVTEAGYTRLIIDTSNEDLLPKRIPNPSRPLTQGVKSSMIIYASDSGHEQRRMRSQPKTTFDLQWVALTQDQYITIRDFFYKVMNVTPFYYKHPLENSIHLVRFDMETFSATNKSHAPFAGALYELQVKLLQVWS